MKLKKLNVCNFKADELKNILFNSAASLEEFKVHAAFVNERSQGFSSLSCIMNKLTKIHIKLGKTKIAGIGNLLNLCSQTLQDLNLDGEHVGVCVEDLNTHLSQLKTLSLKCRLDTGVVNLLDHCDAGVEKLIMDCQDLSKLNDLECQAMSRLKVVSISNASIGVVGIKTLMSKCYSSIQSLELINVDLRDMNKLDVLPVKLNQINLDGCYGIDKLPERLKSYLTYVEFLNINIVDRRERLGFYDYDYEDINSYQDYPQDSRHSKKLGSIIGDFLYYLDVNEMEGRGVRNYVPRLRFLNIFPAIDKYDAECIKKYFHGIQVFAKNIPL